MRKHPVFLLWREKKRAIYWGVSMEAFTKP